MARHRPTLDELRDELGRGGIVEAEIRNPGSHISGYCDHDTQIVVVNPKPELTDTILHELMHRRWPRWGEARVRGETRRLLSTMTDADVAAFVRAYRRRAHRLRRPVALGSAPS